MQPRLLIGVEQVPDQPCLPLHAAALTGPRIPLGPPPVFRGGDHQHIGGVTDLPGHPLRPVLPPLGGRHVRVGVNAVLAQEPPEIPHPVLMHTVIMGVRDEHPHRDPGSLIRPRAGRAPPIRRHHDNPPTRTDDDRRTASALSAGTTLPARRRGNHHDVPGDAYGRNRSPARHQKQTPAPGNEQAATMTSTRQQCKGPATGDHWLDHRPEEYQQSKRH